ncbi:MAG: hypothetical protein EOO58_00750 [Hymenobacter sp.]|nr:MAG: hypothetical protein EOO58_00750 [Hymenobacter sp.]
MPYDLPFERIIKVDNESALDLNKALASELIVAFPEIHDLNTVDSGAHFTQFEIDSEDEFSELHFRLWAELDEMNFGFSFWKDTIWLELGAAGNPTIRFTQVHKYAEFIVRHGFAISGVSSSEKPNLNKGIEEHLKEYKDWVGFVDYVVKALNDKPSVTE